MRDYTPKDGRGLNANPRVSVTTFNITYYASSIQVHQEYYEEKVGISQL